MPLLLLLLWGLLLVLHPCHQKQQPGWWLLLLPLLLLAQAGQQAHRLLLWHPPQQQQLLPHHPRHHHLLLLPLPLSLLLQPLAWQQLLLLQLQGPAPPAGQTSGGGRSTRPPRWRVTGCDFDHGCTGPSSGARQHLGST